MMIALISLWTKRRRPYGIHTFSDLEIPADTSLLQQLPLDPDCVGGRLELRKLVSCRILLAIGDKVPYTVLNLQEENNFRFGGRKFLRCVCSELESRTRSRPCTPTRRSVTSRTRRNISNLLGTMLKGREQRPRLHDEVIEVFSIEHSSNVFDRDTKYIFS